MKNQYNHTEENVRKQDIERVRKARNFKKWCITVLEYNDDSMIQMSDSLDALYDRVAGLKKIPLTRYEHSTIDALYDLLFEMLNGPGSVK